MNNNNVKRTITAVGDVILLSEMPGDYDFGEIANIVSRGDLRLFNLESVISDTPVFASSYCGGTWLVGSSKRLDETLRFGFNACSYANNHTMDYSYDGLMATHKALADRKLSACGGGLDLSEASACVKVRTEKSALGAISLSATFNDAARAGYPSPGVPGRPGLNPLRFHTVYNVTKEHLQAIAEMAEGTQVDGRRNLSRAGGYTSKVPGGMVGFGDYLFRESKTEGKHTVADKNDIKRTVDTIRAALNDTELITVTVHSHEIPHITDDEPDDFFVEFAKACIDAGAAVVCTGTHQLKAIELYAGKPIFYSLGNFIFQSDSVDRLPYDFAEKYNIPAGLSPEEQIAYRNRGGSGLQSDVACFRSVLPQMTFTGGRLTEPVLHPLRLDIDTGLPHLADKAEADIIFNRLKELSAPYGTNLSLSGGEIRVKL